MAILGIGVDVVHAPRIAALLSRRCPQRFAARMLSHEELAQWESLSTSDLLGRVRFLAVRYGSTIICVDPFLSSYLAGVSRKQRTKLCTHMCDQLGRS